MTDAEIRILQAEERHHSERLALMRAKLYRGGAASTHRVLELERELERAQRRLQAARHRQTH